MFDQRAQTWDSDPSKTERARAAANAIRKRVPLNPEMKALEYGCGTGLLSFALRPWLGPITLADTSDGMLDVLSKKIKAAHAADMTPLRLDLCQDPLPTERFDLIYSLMTLHHIPDTKNILNRFHAILNSNGWLCIADLDKEDGSFHGAGFNGHNGFERTALKQITEAAGFAILHFETVFTMQREIAGKRRSFPLFLMIARRDG